MPCGCLGPVATRRPLEPGNAGSRSAVTPVSTGDTGRISPPPELGWFSQGFSRAVLPIVPWRALSARKPRVCGAFAHAPKRTRTSTRESPDKALNLARLPIPPPAQVGWPGRDGRWRWPSIALRRGSSGPPLTRAPARAARSGPAAAARTTSGGEHAARAERRHRDGRRGGLDQRAGEGAAGGDADGDPGRGPREGLGDRARPARGRRASRWPRRRSARSSRRRRAAAGRARPARPRRRRAAWREAPGARARWPGAAAGRRRRRGGRWRARRASSRRPTAPSRTPVSSRWPVASSAAGTTTSTAPTDRPQSTKTATSTRTPGPRSAPVRSRATLRVRAPRARDRVRGEGEVADEQEGRAGRHRGARSTTSRCPATMRTGPQM